MALLTFSTPKESSIFEDDEKEASITLPAMDEDDKADIDALSRLADAWSATLANSKRNRKQVKTKSNHHNQNRDEWI